MFGRFTSETIRSRIFFYWEIFGYWFCLLTAAAAAKSLQSCSTLCDPIDGSPPGSSVPGILQARTLEWVAISFSNVCKWKVKVKLLSDFWLFRTPWTAAYQAPPSMGFSRQEYWSGVPLPSPIHTCWLSANRASMECPCRLWAAGPRSHSSSEHRPTAPGTGPSRCHWWLEWGEGVGLRESGV